jgi:hypothetical protein
MESKLKDTSNKWAQIKQRRSHNQYERNEVQQNRDSHHTSMK